MHPGELNTSVGKSATRPLSQALSARHPRPTDEMYVHYLGHAGFIVETARMIIAMDPWLSPSGAFDSAWFQFPRNHHLAAFVHELMSDNTRERFVYISHEHKDHFDPAFLRSLPTRDFTFIIPRFRHDSLTDLVKAIGAREVLSCSDGETVCLPDGSITLYTDDTEINRDSAAVVRTEAGSFMDLNDCKIYDELPEIMRSQRTIDVFTCQFSGASWHPTCYEYSRDEYEKLSKKRYLAKFESVARAILTVNPRLYLPSAGPACFLDPELLHLNFEPVNVFPRAPRFLDYLSKRLKQSPVLCTELAPGDGVDVRTLRIDASTPRPVTEDTFESYIREYAQTYAQFFNARRHTSERDGTSAILRSLVEVLQEKLKHFTLAERVTHTLYLSVEKTAQIVKVDFQQRTVTLTTEMNKSFCYCFRTRAGEIARLLEGRITWADFLLTFRFEVTRDPDIYQTLVHGFLVLDADDLDPFCAQVLALESNTERIQVAAGGATYAINRYCPHSGADLSTAAVEDDRYVICPRHGWKFDLEQQGKCVNNPASLNAMCLEDCIGEWSRPMEQGGLHSIQPLLSNQSASAD